MVRVLELFSGTHSIGKVCAERDYKVISLDLNLPATIKVDILKWDYKLYPVGYFDLITASPVCLWWSQLRLCNIGKVLKAHPEGKFTRKMYEDDIINFGRPMVDKVMEIIKYFKPKYFWIENPQTGRMKDYITDLPYYDVDYCRYADWGYKKSTRIWTNIKNFIPKKCNKKCNSIEGTRHKKIIGGSCIITEDGKKIYISTKKARAKLKLSGVNYISEKSKDTTKYERYRIPPVLIKELLNHCNF
jgi:hypothetical protein